LRAFGNTGEPSPRCVRFRAGYGVPDSRRILPIHQPAAPMERTELEKRSQLFDVFWKIMAEGCEAAARAEQRRLDGFRAVDTPRDKKTEWIIDALEGLASAHEEAAEAWKAIALGGRVLDMPGDVAREMADRFADKAEFARKRAANMRTMATTAADEESIEVFEEAAEARDDEATAWEKARAFLTAYADVEAAGAWDQVD